jgi:hypothetical protein
VNRQEAPRWRTSSYTNNGGACVEVADNLPSVILVRDTKDRQGPVLTLAPQQWRTFVAGIRSGKLS